MLKAALAGALALAVMGSSLAVAETTGTASAQHASVAESGPVVTTAQIVRLKAVLKLTAAQERHWPAVETALRDLARRRTALSANGQDARRVMILALPLINSLNDDQKRDAIVMARAMGFPAVVSAL